MNKNFEQYKEFFTGKAETFAELTKQASALSAVRDKCEPTADELALYTDKVDAAAANLCEVYRAQRISELLAMGTGAKMWAEFLANRKCKTVRVRFDTKAGKYIVVEDMRGYINYPELNRAYIQEESARKDKAGEIYDVADLTIAADRKFNTYAHLVFADLYKVFIEHNLGKAAAGEKAYTMQARNGAEVKAKIPSVTQMQKDMDELLYLLLPADLLAKYKLHFVKADVRKMGVALNGANTEVFKAKGDGFAYHWFLKTIQERIEGKVSTVIVEEHGMDKVRTIEQGATDAQKDAAKASARKTSQPAKAEPKAKTEAAAK